MKSDWSKISTDDLITIHEAFNGAAENEDGTRTIFLNSVHWSRCFEVMHEIGFEMLERNEPRSPQHDSMLRLRHATQELHYARERRPKWRLWLPTAEEEAADSRWKAAIADVRRTNVSPATIAREVDAPIKQILGILHDFGLS